MSIRKLLEQASEAISLYKDPDISEARERLNEILVAADLGSTLHDEITALIFYKDEVEVRTRHFIRGCEGDREFRFPTAILDARDPIATARLWGLRKKHAKAANDLSEAERTVKWRRDALAKVEAELTAQSA